MKKWIVCLLAFGLTSSLHAQTHVKSLKDESGNSPYSGPRTILCPESSIYSHQVNYDNGLSSQEGHAMPADTA